MPYIQKTVRLNAAVRRMPRWVLEAVVAHELAHVLQQSQAANSSYSSDADLEREANAAADTPGPLAIEHSAAPGSLQRQGSLPPDFVVGTLIPELTANVRRATSIVVEASDPAGEPVAVAADAFEARCLLHEIDHLDGVLFLDRVDSLSGDVFRRKRY